MTARRLLLLAILLGSLSGCGAPSEGPASPAAEYGQPLQFIFGTIDGGELSSDTTRGRATALLFVTTYDLPSQAEAQLLRDVLQTHKPLANAGIVIVEPPRVAALAQVWADSLGLKQPIAMASPTLMSGESAFGPIALVPTLVVLDRRGRLVAKSEGAVGRAAIAELLRRADDR